MSEQRMPKVFCIEIISQGLDVLCSLEKEEEIVTPFGENCQSVMWSIDEKGAISDYLVEGDVCLEAILGLLISIPEMEGKWEVRDTTKFFKQVRTGAPVLYDLPFVSLTLLRTGLERIVAVREDNLVRQLERYKGSRYPSYTAEVIDKEVKTP